MMINTLFSRDFKRPNPQPDRLWKEVRTNESAKSGRRLRNCPTAQGRRRDEVPSRQTTCILFYRGLTEETFSIPKVPFQPCGTNIGNP